MAIRIPPGVFRGESPGFILNHYSDTSLIRWQNGQMTPIGGWTRKNLTALLDIPRAAHVWYDVNSNAHTAYMCDGRLVTELGGTFAQARAPTDFVSAVSTGAQGYGSGDFGAGAYGSDAVARGTVGNIAQNLVTFSLDNWNTELLAMSSADGRLLNWKPDTPTARATVVAAAAGQGTIPTFMQAFLVTEERHVMIFGGTYADGFKPNRVAWSDRENYQRWNFADVAGQAGYFDLQGAGKILAARRVPGGILIFTSSSVWLGRYLGAPYFYGFNKIAEGATPISAQSIAVAGGRAYWMGSRGFWSYEGGVVSPLPTTLGRHPFDIMDFDAASNRVYAGFNGAFPEIWFFYPSERGLAPLQSENDRYVVYNFQEGWWATGILPRSIFLSSPIHGYPLGADSEGWVYEHETGWLAEGSTRSGMVYAEIGNMSPDDGEYNWQYNQAQVDSPLGPDSLRFNFYGRRARGGPEVPLQLNVVPRPDGYLDLHFTAKDVRVLIESVEDGPWATGAFVVHDMKRRGRV